MPEFELLGEAPKSGGTSKKLFKNKKFLLAAGAVGVVALIVGYKKNQNQPADDGGLSAVGYAGYPTTTGGGSDSDMGNYYSDYYQSVIDENNAYYDSYISDMEQSHALDMDELNSNITSLSDRLTSAESLAADQNEAIKRQNVISQMRANSELYNTITDDLTKQALHTENMALADSMGWKYDSTSGNYLEGNSVVYTTARQQAQALGAKASSSGSASFDSNVDYQAKINEAILSGASATTINDLNKARNAKIAAGGGSTAAANNSYDANTDYQELINKAKASGADQSVIDNLTAQRNAKIAASK